MNIFSWIFLSLFVISIGLYIFSFVKNKQLLINISKSAILPFLGAFTIACLISSLPDSYHTLIISIYSFLCISAAQILLIFEEKKNCKIIARVLFLIYMLMWIRFYSTTFYLYRIPVWVNILSITIYSLVLISTILFLGKLTFLYTLLLAAYEIVSLFFCYCALITLCYAKKNYSILLFCGTTLFLALQIYYVLNYKKYHFKNEKIVRTLALTISQTLLALAEIFIFI